MKPTRQKNPQLWENVWNRQPALGQSCGLRSNPHLRGDLYPAVGRINGLIHKLLRNKLISMHTNNSLNIQFSIFIFYTARPMVRMYCRTSILLLILLHRPKIMLCFMYSTHMLVTCVSMILWNIFRLSYVFYSLYL